jgi:carboxypeptidase C (cathepsin A)
MPSETTANTAVTTHTSVVNGKSFDYTATVGETVMPDASGNPGATVFSFAYTKDGEDPATRPVLFIFNGGPGGSTLYFHFGGFGPVRAEVPSDFTGLHAPYRSLPNEETLLDVADLVFIDPPGTGFARLLAEDQAPNYLGVNQDAVLLSSFIRRWLSVHGRWSSPKFLMGESYGALRVAVLARELMGSVGAGMLRGAALNGVIVIGQAMNMGSTHSELRYAMNLPTMAAIAWHHRKVKRESRQLADVLSEAQSFVTSEYVSALYLGVRLPEAQKTEISRRLEELTGIAAATWFDAGLRIDAKTFSETLLSAERKLISVYDGRYSQPVQPHVLDPVADDPMLTHAAVACHVALQQQLSGPLNYRSSEEYQLINFKTNAVWDWKQTEVGAPVYLDVGPTLAASLNRNPGMHLFVGSGAFDLVTPWGSANHLVTRKEFPQERVTHKTYPSGHCPYIGADERTAIAADLREFIRQASSSPVEGKHDHTLP